jgi:hypothetical protein
MSRDDDSEMSCDEEEDLSMVEELDASDHECLDQQTKDRVMLDLALDQLVNSVFVPGKMPRDTDREYILALIEADKCGLLLEFKAAVSERRDRSIRMVDAAALLYHNPRSIMASHIRNFQATK